ncbi:MAG: guanylate kinase [Deltaproteobacteria bacterium]|nr:guanylate kinase [Deltaproteobacteria bacterium]
MSCDFREPRFVGEKETETAEERKDSDGEETAEGTLLVLSAPSGAGKTSLSRALLKTFPDLRPSVSFTTRAPRGKEVDGVDYFFVGDAEFDRMAAAGDFAEWAVVHGNRYGTAKATLDEARRQGQDILLDIDCQGAHRLRQNGEEGVFVFILPPSLDELTRRLRARNTESPEDVDIRIRNAWKEIPAASWYDYIVINDDFDRALEELAAIVLAERCRTVRRAGFLHRFFLDGKR